MDSFLFSQLLTFFATFGVIKSRLVAGGIGIFCNGTMFALVSNNSLYLRATAENETDFSRLGMRPFSYMDQDSVVETNYYAVPEHWWQYSDELLNQVTKVLTIVQDENKHQTTTLTNNFQLTTKPAPLNINCEAV